MDLVQQAINSGGATGVPLTFSPSPLNGNILIAVISMASKTSLRTISSISQTGVTWTNITRPATGLQSLEIWKGVVGASAGTGATVNTSGTINGLAVNIAEFSGVTGTQDFTAATTTGTGFTATTGTYTTLTANDLVIMAVGMADGAVLTTDGSGLTPLTFASITGCGVQGDYQLTNSTGLKSAGSYTIHVSVAWVTAVIGLQGIPVMGIPPGTLSPCFTFFDTGQYSLGA